jgi:hypothetical protein
VTLRGSPCIGSLVLTALTCSAELFPNFEFGSNVVTDLASGNAGALRGDAAGEDLPACDGADCTIVGE